MRRTDYGRKLSDSEYELAVVELYGDQPEYPTKSEDREVRRKELDLMVDHRLGIDFPLDKREALWQVQQSVERKRLGMAARFIFGKLSLGQKSQKADSLAAWMVDEYAKVLGREDAEHFFGLERAEPPSVPVDFER